MVVVSDKTTKYYYFIWFRFVKHVPYKGTTTLGLGTPNYFFLTE